MLVLLTILSFNFEAGVVQLEKEGDFYFTKLMDSVHIYDDTLDIHGVYGIFNERENSLFIGGDVMLKTPTIKASSDSLVIREDGDIIHFMGRCEIIREDQDTLWGGKVIIHKDTLLAYGDVAGNSASRNIRFFSDTLLVYDSLYILWGNTVKVQKGDLDSLLFLGTYLIVSKDTLYSDRRPTVKVGKYTARGDTLFYYEGDSSGIFIGNVGVMWDSGSVKSDTAYFYFSSDRLDSIIFKGQCHLDKYSEEDKIELAGKVFKVFFENDSIKELVAERSRGVLRNRKNE